MGDAKYTPEEDDNGLGMFPSAANPLTALGIDPDMARANPELLTALNPNAAQNGAQAATPVAKPIPGPIPGPVAMPSEEPPPSASAKAAGAMGGAAQAPVPPAAITPSTATDYGMAGLATLNQNAKLATDATADIPTSNPEINRLTAERAKYAAPAPLYNPVTGKMLDQTTEIDPATGQPVTINPKPTTGTRVWRGVRGGLQGLLTGGIRGGLLGAISPALEGSEAYGAPNKAYQSAEEQREAKLAATDASLKTKFENWKQAVEAAKARTAAAAGAGALGRDLTSSATGMENAATAAAREREKENVDAQNTPEAKTAEDLRKQQMEIDQRRSDPTAKSLPAGYIRNRYVLTGQLQAAHDSTAEEQRVGQLTSAWIREHHGQRPGTTDLADIYKQALARSEGGKGNQDTDDQVGSIVADSDSKKQAFSDQWMRRPDGNYQSTTILGKRLTAQQFKDKIDQFRTTANTKLAKFGAKIDEQGNLVHKDSADNPQADLVTVRTSDGKGGFVEGTIPRANLAAAQKRDPKLSVLNK